MEQEQQGFVPEKTCTFIDYKHVSYSLPKEVKKNPFSNKKNIQHRHSKIKILSEIHENPFINSSIRKDYFHQFIQQNHKNLVFNSFNPKNIGLQENNVVFDASLPCGNLELAIRKKFLEYDLYMRPDTNTSSHFQWFYFRVHINKKKKVKFVIKNFIKATMLYSKGLRPFYKSKRQMKGDKFVQLKEQVKFYENQQEEYFNLEFIFDFKYDDDQVYFCSQPPYGLNQLNKTLLKINNCKKLHLCKTIMGNKIPYLIFPQKKQCKIIAVAIARQHPGQAVGSWMMQGFLKALHQGKYSQYVQWIVIPMLNIDGVQLGNNRTGVLGHDFNRNWDIQQNTKKQKIFAENAGVLSLLKKIKRKYPKKMKLFLDFHGHSSQQNVFAYGPPHDKSSDYFYISRLLPQIIAQKNSNFKLDQSSYVLKGDKKNAARSVIYTQCRIPFTYTIQCTFGVMNDNRIGIEQMIKVGYDIAISSKQFIELCFLKQQLKNQLKSETAILKIKQKYSHLDQGDQYESASQSSEQNEKREQFQNNVKLLLQQPEPIIKNSMKHIKTQENSCRQTEITIRKQPEQKSFITAFKRQSMNNSPLGQVCHIKPNHRIKRISTQQSPVVSQSQKCCYFPPIRQKKSLNKFIFSQDQNPTTLNLKQIQKRLFKLRNSRIGKKILIINAYGV